jgi:hypothetical protein
VAGVIKADEFMPCYVLMRRGGIVPSNFANEHRHRVKRAILKSAQNAVALLKSPRPLDASCALFDVGNDFIDEIRPPAIAEVVNDGIPNCGATNKRRTMREIMDGAWGKAS